MSVSAIYAGAVTHQRLRPVRHRLRHAIFDLLLDLDELPGLASRLRWFSHERFNLFAFHERDHGDGTQGGLRAWVEASLAAAGFSSAHCIIRILCMPRILGHAFNPISVYFCGRADGTLDAILYEVNNTFGQRHTYLMRVDDAAPGAEIRQSCEKLLYVSPFIPMDMTYRFRVSPPGERVALGITASDAEGVLIATAFTGKREPLTDAALLRKLLRMPVMGLHVVADIHWQALKLWCRGLRLLPKPAAPEAALSFKTVSIQS